MSIIINVLITALVVFVCAKIMKGVQVKGYWSACIVAIVLACLNALASWLLARLSLDKIFTGAIGFAINLCLNAAIIYIASGMLDSFQVKNYKWALGLALVCAFTSSLFGGIFGAIG